MNRSSFVSVRATDLWPSSVLVLIAFALLASLSASAWSEWTLVESSHEFDLYADLTTIRKKGNTVKMWVLREYGSVQRVQGRVFLSARMLEEYDCTEERSRFLAMSFHSAQTAGGQVIATTSRPTEWLPVAPGTVG